MAIYPTAIYDNDGQKANYSVDFPLLASRSPLICRDRDILVNIDIHQAY